MHRVAQPGPPAPTRLSVPQGELTITTDMEDLSTALFYDTVPETWMARAYPSMMGLAAWYTDLVLRIRVRMGSLASVHPVPRARCKGVCPEACAPAGLAFVRAGSGGCAHATDADNAGPSSRGRTAAS